MTKPEKCFSSMSDAVMYAYIKRLVHSLLKSIRQKQQKVAEKAAQKTAEKGPRQQKPPQQDQQRPQLEDDDWTIVTYSKSRLKHPHTVSEKRVPENHVHHIMLTYNQRNKEMTDSNTRALPTVLAHSDTQAQMSIANKPELVKKFKEMHTSQAWVVSCSQTKLTFSPMLFHS
jgi:hypothetical protein